MPVLVCGFQALLTYHETARTVPDVLREAANSGVVEAAA
jgi:hypothetical protein